MALRRGDLVTVAISGDYGKPRPALVVQADAFEALDSVTVLRITSDLRDAPALRIAVDPSADNGLKRASQIMIDKAATVARDRLRGPIGRADDGTMAKVDMALVLFLGLAKQRADFTAFDRLMARPGGEAPCAGDLVD